MLLSSTVVVEMPLAMPAPSTAGARRRPIHAGSAVVAATIPVIAVRDADAAAASLAVAAGGASRIWAVNEVAWRGATSNDSSIKSFA